MKNSLGITLPELLAVLGICAILALLGLPALGSLVLDGRMTAAANALVRSVHLGWQDAQATLSDIVICRSANGVQCANSGNWDGGWLVFVNRDHDDPPMVDSGEPILDVAQPSGPLTIRGNRASFVLRPSPLRSTNGTIVICDRRGPAKARAVIISYTGHPRVSDRNASGGSLTCVP